MTRDVFARRYAIAGLGLVADRFPERTARTLQVEAARLAVADAGLPRDRIDGAINAAHEIAPPFSDNFARVLGLPVKFSITMGRGGGLVPQALLAATQALHLGLARYVVVAYGASDWSRSRNSTRRGQHVEKTGTWGKPYGDLNAASHHSLFMSRHMHEFGTTHEQLGAVAVAARRWAQRNPDARLRERPLTVEEYLAAPFVIEPYRAADMCLISDVGVAFVLTTAERARELPKTPVYLLGLGFGEAIEHLWWEKANYTRLAVESAKQAAFEQAGIALADVDVAQLYDCFTGEVILQLEDYGWCGKGEGGPFAASGAIAPGGTTPVNTGGGLLASYHASDFTMLVETVRQLRGEAGERQVPTARIGLMSGHGGEMLGPGMCSLHATYCRACPAEPFYGNMSWTPSSGRGRVFAFNIHRRSSHAGFADAVPYVFALIELDEGPIFGCNVVGCGPDEVRIGMPVRVRYAQLQPAGGEPFTLANFEPDADEARP
jgi:acetyl-CoA acetyltransferase/uncharacterized OB-fold protein